MKPSRPQPRWADSRPSSLVPRPSTGQRATPASTGEQRTMPPCSGGAQLSGKVALFRKSSGRHHHKEQTCHDARKCQEGPALPVDESMVGRVHEDKG
jgi:hypothetical protein